MATPRDLIEVVAAEYKRPIGAVEAVNRVIREANIIEKKGFGRGSVKVTPRHAAALLIAAALGPPLADLPRRVTEYLTLPLRVRTGGDRSVPYNKWSHFPLLNSNGPHNTFGEALAGIIELAVLVEIQHEFQAPDHSYLSIILESEPQAKLVATKLTSEARPQLIEETMYFLLDSDETHMYWDSYGEIPDDVPDDVMELIQEKNRGSALFQTWVVGLKAIWSVADLLRS